MFKFLKKKLKVFEDKLEAELEAELKNDLEPEQKTSVELQDKIETDISKLAPTELKDTIKDKKKEDIQYGKITESSKVEVEPQKRNQQLTRKKRIERDVRKREKQIDSQIEKSIETELRHVLRTKKSIKDVIKQTGKKSRVISEEKLDELLWELEIGLLESDVAYTVIESIKNDIKEEFKYTSVEKSKISEVIENVLRNAIANVLISNDINFENFINKTEKPVVIMFVGVNGSGKTLSIAKMATALKKMGKSSVMAAGDTFRAGAIEQLTIHADKIGVKIIKHGSGADPAAVAFDAIEHAKAKHKDVVLLDTAGRMQTNVNLMDEMAKIKRVAKPHFILFVGDALSGNDAVEQAKRFNEIVGIDGVILTKVDTDAKGGSALSVAYTIGKPLLFIGVGQGYEDQIPFDPQWMIENIFSR